MDITALVIFCILISTLFIYLSRRDQRLPPGPFKWPIVGNIFSIAPARDYMTYTRWTQYGEVFGAYMGTQLVVVLNSLRAVNEAFVGQADVFSGRIKSDYFDMVTHESGILFQDGPKWQEHRRFTLRMLRDFGIGRNLGETIVREECEALCAEIEGLVGEKVSTRPLFSSAINNVISRLTLGERCGTDDPHFKKFAENIDATLELNIVDIIPSIAPWVLKMPPLLRFVERFSYMRRKIEEMHTYINGKIKAHMDALKDSPAPITDLSEASNICEAYLIEQKRQEEISPGSHTFTEWQIIRNVLELFLAGTETTSTTLTWALLLLAINPDIQKKTRKEIVDAIGHEQIPTMSDLKMLPYVHAVMDEVLRYSSLVPSNVGHRTLEDTELMGYFIPYNTIIISNLYGIHHDPHSWAKPYEFYPEHFLDNDGQYMPSKHLIPFSLGKRACLGEGLAKMEYFVVFVSLLQRFEVRLNDYSKQKLDDILLGAPGAIRKPLDHSIIFSKIECEY